MNSRKHRELITGSFQPALEDALAGRIRAVKKNAPGASVLVLVGSFALTQYLPRRIAADVPLWNVHFLDFRGLINRLTPPLLRASGRRRLPRAAAKLVIGDVVSKGDAGYFARVAALPGFAGAAAETIRDLKDAGVASAALGRSRDGKAAALKRIFDGYDAALETSARCDNADLLALAAGAAPESGFVRESDFIAYGFYDLTGLQRRLVLALASAARSACVMAPFEDAPACDYARPLLDWLRANNFTEAAAASDAMTARLFTSPNGEALDDGRFRIVSAPGEAREVREIVRQVLASAKQGVPFHEIGILLHQRETYSRLLRDALDACGIPYFILGGAPLAETREARSLVMLGNLLAGDLPRTDVMEFVHFAPIDFGRLLGRSPNTPAWDLLTIEAGIIAGAAQWPARLARLDPDEYGEELAGLKTFVAALIEAKKSVPLSGAWAGIVGALLDVSDRLFTASDAQGKVRSAVAALADLDDLGVAAAFDGVREALRETLERESVPSAGFQRGKVYVGDLLQSRGLGFRAVIVPGLVERGFPSVGRQDPILLDAERRAIQDKAGADAYLRTKAERAAEERTLFALAAGAGSEHVTFTFPRLDVASARERVPSHFLTRLVEALTGERCDYSTLHAAPCFEQVPMFPVSGADGEDVDLDEHDLRTVAGLSKPSHALFLAQVSEPFQRGIDVETARWQEKRLTSFDGLAASVAGQTIAGEVMSPTRIETYAACPFVYFLKYVLGVDALEEPEAVERLPALERGSLIHHILYAAYTTLFAGGRKASADALAKELVRAANRQFTKLRTAVPPLTWALDRAEITADLKRFAALDAEACAAAGARPAMFETRFGMRPRDGEEDEASTEQPLVLAIEGREYKFRGKIDRIDDLGPGEARVIDYKTGRASGRDNAFDGGRTLQLPLYILAAQMLRPDRRVLGARYAFATGRGEFRTVAFSREALDQRLGELEGIIQTVESHIEKGVFAATPDKNRCKFCDRRAACCVNRDVIFERKKADPLIAGLLEMAEIE